MLAKRPPVTLDGTMKKLAFPLAAGLVLTVLIAVQLYAAMQPAPVPSYIGELADRLPRSIPGWQVEDLNLGATESVTERSERLLNLDDWVHRSYRAGDLEFSVYVGFWGAGKMPIRLVHQHTPDRCWTEVGWACEDRQWNVVKPGPDGTLPPAQWGVYEIHGFRTHTYFWHMVDGRAYWPHAGRLNTRTSATAFLGELRRYGLNLKREQFFVRLNSSRPFDEVWQTPAFQAVLAELQELCLKPDA
jgi:hypothetical protein